MDKDISTSAGQQLNKPFLKSISKELRGELDKAAVTSKFDTSAIIFTEGESADHLPIVLSGKIKMVHLLEGGKEMIINIFEAGEMFAVPPVFDGGKYPASAIAMEPTRLLLVERGKFLRLLEASPELSFYVIGWMCEMLREKTATIQNLATPSPDSRVAHILSRLIEKHVEGEPAKISLRRQDIAEMAGLTTETTIRVIRRLAAMDLITISHGKIFIDSPEPLRKFLRQRA